MVKPPDRSSVNTHGNDALKQFAESLAAESDVDPAMMREALIILCGHLLRKYASISRQDVADVANDAVARVVAKSNSGVLRSDLNPTVYLLRTAEHTAVDHLRRKDATARKWFRTRNSSIRFALTMRRPRCSNAKPLLNWCTTP